MLIRCHRPVGYHCIDEVTYEGTDPDQLKNIVHVYVCKHVHMFVLTFLN